MHQRFEDDDQSSVQADLDRKCVNADLDRRFNYHQCDNAQAITMSAMRGRLRDLAWDIVCNSPAGREQALAITNLEQVMFWFNAAVARHG